MGFQGLEIVEALAFLVIVGALIWPLVAPWRLRHASSFWPVLGGILGLTVGLLAIVLRFDVIPDEFEPAGRSFLVGGVVGGGALLALREVFSHRSS